MSDFSIDSVIIDGFSGVLKGTAGVISDAATTADLPDSANKRYVTDAQLTTIGLTTGTNTGDQTSIVGITGTKAQFNTAVTDGDIVYLDSTDTITGVKTMTGLNAVLHSSSGLTIRNPGDTFKYTVTAAAIAADRVLNLPLITGTDTLGALGLAQTWSAVQTFVAPVLGTPTSGTLTNCTGYTDANLSTSDITTNDFTTAKHGFVPKGTNVGNFLKDDGTWAAPAGGGDMVLASAQTNSGVKTFLDTTMKLRNVANTFDGYFVNTNTANRVYTLKDAAGTIAFTSDITGTNSGTNTGDQTSIVGISGTKAEFNTAVSDGNIVFLDSVDTIAGAKTFNDTKLLMRNVADTFNGSFTNANTADRTYTLPNRTGTILDNTDKNTMVGISLVTIGGYI